MLPVMKIRDITCYFYKMPRFLCRQYGCILCIYVGVCVCVCVYVCVCIYIYI